jgi:hypothetical protein
MKIEDSLNILVSTKHSSLISASADISFRSKDSSNNLSSSHKIKFEYDEDQR